MNMDKVTGWAFRIAVMAVAASAVLILLLVVAVFIKALS